MHRGLHDLRECKLYLLLDAFLSGRVVKDCLVVDRQDIAEPHAVHLPQMLFNDIPIHPLRVVRCFGFVDCQPPPGVVQKQDVFISDGFKVLNFVVVGCHLCFQILTAFLRPDRNIVLFPINITSIPHTGLKIPVLLLCILRLCHL